MVGNTLGEKIEKIKKLIEEENHKENIDGTIQRIKTIIENGMDLWLRADKKRVVVYPENHAGTDCRIFDSTQNTQLPLSFIPEPLLSASIHLMEKEKVKLEFIMKDNIAMCVLVL